MARKPDTTAPSPGQPLDGQGVRRISRLKIARSKLRIGTWNVRSLYAAGKFENLVQEINRMKLQITGVSELRWPGSGACKHENGTLYYSGGDEGEPGHRNGVGIFVTAELAKYVINFVPINDRIILLQLGASPFNINVLQIYAPTAEKRYDDEVESLYSQLDIIMKTLKNNEITYVLGDFNAKIGQGSRSDLVGEHGLGESNARGDRLFEFCQDHNMVVTNTWFKLHKRRLYTWRGPGDNPTHIIRNQIDYILINKRFRNCVNRVTTYPGADVGSDHNPLVADTRVKLKRLKNSTQHIKFRLAENNKEIFAKDLNNCIKEFRTVDNVDEIWKSFKELTNKLMTEHTVRQDTPKKQKWMTSEILHLMEQRRQYKTNPEEYKRRQKEIKQKIRIAKENWMKEKCMEMEDLENRHDTFNMYKKVREVAGLYNKNTTNMLVDTEGKNILDEKEILGTWLKYINELFDDNRPNEPNFDDHANIDGGPEILKSEVLFAIKSAKTKKATGPDDIPTELLQMIKEENIGILVKLFNAVYATGDIPEDWLKSVFIPIPKKQRAKRCSEYRLISLMSHTLKVFLKIIHARIRAKCEADLDETQFGFRNALGTREALFALNILLQKCRDQRKDVFVCFVDYEKAFDRVQHIQLINILRNMEVDNRDVRIIENLYWRQKAAVRLNGKLTEESQILRGVRQGCILSPLLFNIYSDKIFKRATQEQEMGVQINGEYINTIRYADDTVILSDKLEDLQHLLNCVNAEGQEMGLNININKTKFMVFSRQPHLDASLQINTKNIDRVTQFKYLGCYITEQLNPDREIRCRIETARTTFQKMKPLFCNDNLNLKLRQRMVKSYIWSVLLYGAEVWTIKAATVNRLEAFEMWLHRRMLRIPWTDMQTNEMVLSRADATRLLLNTVKCRKISYLGHIFRGERYRILQLIMMGKVEGRRGVGRKQASWLRDIREWTGIRSAEELFRLAQNRERLAQVIANVRGT